MLKQYGRRLDERGDSMGTTISMDKVNTAEELVLRTKGTTFHTSLKDKIYIIREVTSHTVLLLVEQEDGHQMAYNFSVRDCVDFINRGFWTTNNPTIGSLSNSCSHQWAKYVGFTEVYEYCKMCDEKRG